MRDGWVIDVWISICTDNIHLQLMNRMILNYLCLNSFFAGVTTAPLSVTMKPTHGVSCYVCASVTFDVIVRELTLSVHLQQRRVCFLGKKRSTLFSPICSWPISTNYSEHLPILKTFGTNTIYSIHQCNLLKYCFTCHN